MTHIENIRSQYNYNRKQVLWLTGMTESQHAQFVFDMGIKWLCEYTHEDAEMMRIVLSQPSIWQWWRNEWQRRDALYLPSLYLNYERDKTEVLEMYKAMHSEINIRFSPPYTVLEDCYATAIGKMHDNLKKQIL